MRIYSLILLDWGFGRHFDPIMIARIAYIITCDGALCDDDGVCVCVCAICNIYINTSTLIAHTTPHSPPSYLTPAGFKFAY